MPSLRRREHKPQTGSYDLVVRMSALHAECREFNPRWEYTKGRNPRWVRIPFKRFDSVAEWSKALVLGTSLRAWVRTPPLSDTRVLTRGVLPLWCRWLAYEPLTLETRVRVPVAEEQCLKSTNRPG